MTRIAIGIQARSTSTRLPNKIEEKLGDKTVLQHVVDAGVAASTYLNNWSSKKVLVETALLIPGGDPIGQAMVNKLRIIQGSEVDVLSRYVVMLDELESQFVCRLTADCPLIPPFVISKMITLAVMNGYDYVSNVDEKCRTTVDGWDCEVVSRRALEYLDKSAVDADDREHVTTFLRRSPPKWLRQGCVINFLDMSEKKLSIDTKEDLQRVREEYQKVDYAYQKAVHIFGKHQVHRW